MNESKLSAGAKRWISIGWSGVNRAARWGKARGILRTKKLPARTIGVGNLQAGGAGKTPLVLRIVREALDRGLLVAVLTRGYRSAWETSGGIIVPHAPAPAPELCGDEAALMRERLPEAWIGVGSDRAAQYDRLQAAATRRLERQFDLVVLDDALQHWKIECDQYVVAVTDAAVGERVFREDYSAVSERDLLVLTKGEAFPQELSDHPRRVHVRYRLEGADPQTRYHFVAALGDPERARAGLVASGFRIEEMTVFPDHHGFEALECERILEEATALGRKVLLTGKDGVKWRALGLKDGAFQVVEPEVEFVEGKEVWEKVLWQGQ